MLTEFGGIACSPRRQDTWGYSRATRRTRLARSDTASCWTSSGRCGVLAGFCYTQFTDTYQEANGLLFADRTPKFPLDDIAAATRGRDAAQTNGVEQLLPVDDR